MADEKMKNKQTENAAEHDGRSARTMPDQQEVSKTWAQETIADLDDFIESQGIYIRQ